MKVSFLLGLFLLLIIITLNAQKGWFWQNQLPQGEHFSDIYAFNSNTAFALLGEGTIINTTNGGRIWHIQPYAGGAKYKLHSIDFINSSEGWVVGEGGTILKTTNAGISWNGESSGTSNSLYSVHFANSNIGWGVGEGGTILKTTNGGISWNGQLSGTSNSLHSVYFTNSNIGWVVGGGGTILKTTNGGISWNGQLSGTSNSLHSVHFANSDTGWVVGVNGAIYKASNAIITFIEDDKTSYPQLNSFLLSQNYPNPFNPATRINYQIPEISFVTIKVYDVLGKEIATLVNEEKPAGSYEIEIDGSELISGIYFYQLRAGDYVETKKMLLLK